MRAVDDEGEVLELVSSEGLVCDLLDHAFVGDVSFWVYVSWLVSDDVLGRHEQGVDLPCCAPEVEYVLVGGILGLYGEVGGPQKDRTCDDADLCAQVDEFSDLGGEARGLGVEVEGVGAYEWCA